MLTDLDLCDLCQAQYDNAPFDHDIIKDGDRCSIKYYLDCSVIVHEGSHDFLNWFNNVRFVMTLATDINCGVDEGFDINIGEMTSQALPLIPKDKPVYFTGHSRGAPRAQLMAARFIKQGYDVRIVVFASPRPGDSILGKLLASVPHTQYRNYHGFLDQDFVCDAPAPYPFGYVHPIEPIIIDVAPPPNDEWGVLARHHLFLYREGIKNG